jgi:hypothetical protein
MLDLPLTKVISTKIRSSIKLETKYHRGLTLADCSNHCYWNDSYKNNQGMAVIENLRTDRSYSTTHSEEVYGNFLWCVGYNELVGE